ncbi:MAG TPA: bifunctional UDP-N-acetylmuramoyl-tripeptide:D-alanyl-D-alanine ligase/alanine racemase [Bacteroidales bacterium]|nr:bifunctional UDP-N-acetylmuramoyl-tripeptide:D-alanyl-D-alanine ligase/alanine racemase [Bacteroidales bacterium]
MPAYSLRSICQMSEGRLHGAPDGGLLIRHLLTDSRRLLAPATTLFVALITPKNDGHKYIDQLFGLGVRCFMVSQLPAGNTQFLNEASFILVDDTLIALQKLAAGHRASFRVPVVAITGSNGKTTVKEWLFQLLSEKLAVVCSPRSFNSQLGVPLSVWQMEDAHRLCIFEAGISEPDEMERLSAVIMPDTVIFTNIGPAHDEGFISREAKIAEKLKLVKSANTLIYCRDYTLLDQTIIQWKERNPYLRLFSWSERPGADLWVQKKETSGNRTRIWMQTEGQTIDFEIPFGDPASFENAMHCLALLCHLGFTNGWIKEKMALLQPVSMRMEMKEAVNQCLVINDSYNNDLYSLDIALGLLNNQTGFSRTTLILSDIYQAGISKELLYSEVAGLVSNAGVGRIIGIGPDISSQRQRFGVPGSFFETTEEFLRAFNQEDFYKEAILLKGARVFGFERISSRLQQKDHQTILEVNLGSLVHNLNVYQSFLSTGVGVMAMVKAFSYGSGSVEIARVLQYHQVDYLAVAYADEGKELRKGGIKLPVMVMNPELHHFEVLFEYNLEPEIHSKGLLLRFAKSALHQPGIDTDHPALIHLEFDTGMHRLGFLPDEIIEVSQILKRNPHLKVATVFSHFAASDEDLQDAFSRQQIAVFNRMRNQLTQLLGYEFRCHISNSAAISRFPEAQFDMVRPGIGLYGISPDPVLSSLLQPVSTFRSVVSQVKRIPAGESIGYNRAAIAAIDTDIAIIPVGYADGLNRRLSNGVGYLLVNGHKAPIAGIISMDMCAVDVTGLNVKEGDEVTIFGKDLPIAEMAKILQTIPYEVLTSVSQRVKRVYFQE